MFNLDFLEQLINIDTTTGKEESIIPLLANYFKKGKISFQIVGTQRNFMVTWGEPKIVFCTHLDTVPPYFPYSSKGECYFGRGACDAKGQIFTQFLVCERLLDKGFHNFAWLGVVGEESNSLGAKIANQSLLESKVIIIGEPTDNHLISATKGTWLIDFFFTGQANHSAYPKEDAISRFLNWAQKFRKIKIPQDPILGKTSYIFSNLQANNAFNVVADSCKGKIFFRTTFRTHNLMDKFIPSVGLKDKLAFIPGTIPLLLKSFPGFPTKTAAFTSDASYFTNIPYKILFGPGSILEAHTPQEKITRSEIENGAKFLYQLFQTIRQENLC